MGRDKSMGGGCGEVDAGGGESAVIRAVHGRGGVQDARGR